jgi:beta-lactam-binding protein with PASTA domain/tRNA A-37 threonylcarbamoyl transferase component Bud32
MTDSTGPHRIGGRYEIGELLGRGGMAEVRKGTDIRLGRTVAVKRLRTDLASDATFQARFRREAQSAASLNHPAIVSVYDTGEEMATDGSNVAQPYIVMEYVAGRTLRDILREGRKILPERAFEITSGVLGALDYSHRAGIIHRDIKPGNVMLTPAGDVKVMDFGIARAVADAHNTMTQTAAVVGTAQYLSPEQARGETVDSRSDVYSTGCLLFELLTGRPPFVGDSPVAVAYQHVREQAPSPSSLDADLPPEVDAIVAKALAKRLEDRYQSAAAMKEDIDRYLAGRPVTAPPVPVEAAVVAPIIPARADTAVTAVVPGASEWVEEPKRRVGPLVLLALLLLAAIIGAILLIPKLIGSAPDKVSVPNFATMTVPQAKAAIRKDGFAVGETIQEPSDTVAAGIVIRSDPAYGDFVEKGAAIDLIVSSGKKMVTIPDVVGQNKATASDQLKALGLKVVLKPKPSDDPKDNVVELSPGVGESVRVGDRVTVYFSQGPQKVPNVIGMTEADAVKALEGAGFTVSSQLDTTSTEKKGTVTNQSPPAGSTQLQGTVIKIFVSTYEPPPPPPSPSSTPTDPTSPTDTPSLF